MFGAHRFAVSAWLACIAVSHALRYRHELQSRILGASDSEMEEGHLAVAQLKYALEEQASLLGSESESVLTQLTTAKEELLNVMDADSAAPSSKNASTTPSSKSASKVTSSKSTPSRVLQAKHPNSSVALNAHGKDEANASSHAKLNRSSMLHQGQDMLTDLFAHMKKSIARLNKRETEGKDSNEKIVARLQAKYDQDRKKLNDTTLSAWEHELLVNRTQMDERELKYWETGRDIQHKMFHTNLKLTHSLMSRVKTVMEAYKQALAHGHIDAKVRKALEAATQSMPKALLESASELRREVSKVNQHHERLLTGTL